jgi:ribosome biogenesis GTPase
MQNDYGIGNYVLKHPQSNIEGVFRVIAEHKTYYVVASPLGAFKGLLPRRVLFKATSDLDIPTVGDFICARRIGMSQEVAIQKVLPRVSVLVRKDAVEERKAREEVIASNIDVVFVVQGLDEGVNSSRLSRYIAMVRSGNSRPVIVLSKSDLDPNAKENAEAATKELGVPVILVSATRGEGVDALRRALKPGETCAFIGRSGAGKSSLMNKLAESDLAQVGAVREGDVKGRHTTVHRELFGISGGVFIIDTPGTREVAPWAEKEAVVDAFDDIKALATECEYSDCDHIKSDGCAIRNAVLSGLLPKNRYDIFISMITAARKKEAATQSMEDRKRRGKSISRELRRFYKDNK